MIVIRNLVSNAIKYTPEGKKVIIQTDEQGDDIIVKVIDEGMGLDDSIIRTFSSNGSTESQMGTDNEKGTGIGLMLSRKFIDLNEGHISMQSQDNIGTQVTFTLKKALT